jgi:transposase-like protein
MLCPQCKSKKTVKNGIAKLKQRFLCKSCNYQFTIAEKYVPKDKKSNYGKRALHLLLEGFSMNETAKMLNIAPSTMQDWQKEWKTALILNSANASEKYSYDEIIHYLNAKKSIKGYTCLLIDLDTDVSFICSSKL